MNAFNQYIDVGKRWAEGQVKTSKGWFESIQGLEPSKPGLILNQTIDAYQASIQGTLDAEVAGAQILFEEVVPVKDLPETAADLVKQMQVITNNFTDTQQTLADNWFNFLRQIDFKGLPLAITKEEQHEAPA